MKSVSHQQNYGSLPSVEGIDHIHHSPSSSRGTPFHHVSKKKLGVLSLTVLVFYEVCGGPFGIEDVVKAGGPFYALLGFLLVLVWAVPEALITAELSTAMPEDSGSVAWVEAAYGPYWAFQKGWVGWLSGVADNALYPILFIDCLVKLFEGGDNGTDGTYEPINSPVAILSDSVDTGGMPAVRWAVIVCITLSLTYLTFRGLDVVGNVAITICIISMLPFAVFCIMALPHIDPSRWLIVPEGGLSGVNWKLLLNTFFWNINFWESASNFSGEVADPGKSFPKGMFWGVVLVFLSLFLPILLGTGASAVPYTEWSDGSFVQIAKTVGGPWLAYSFMISAVLTNVGSFNAEMTSDAWQVAGMADRGHLPSVLGKRNAYDTPTYGILLSALGVFTACTLSFTDVIDITNMLYCLGQLIEFAAFIELRRSKPHMVRPYQVPIGTVGMSVILSFPVMFIFIIMYFSGAKIMLLSIIMASGGIPLKHVLDRAKREQWWHFEDILDGGTATYHNTHDQSEALAQENGGIEQQGQVELEQQGLLTKQNNNNSSNNSSNVRS